MFKSTFDAAMLLKFMKRYIKQLSPKLDSEKQELFKKHIKSATKSLMSKLRDFQFEFCLIGDYFNECDNFVGESMEGEEGSLVLAYYREAATNPTFLYLAYGLKEIKC
ncbi:hypothetical protein ARALYDRAFT_902571 [Arabidopsis lyrata subsp. lyrata]|uniref:TCTP domain-containing protein n=1 Tax=Arabidopsis lyrata subsp. lyrata TaxID=81972 RepID=D7LHP2_ARALL|nr:hypothetical protein ARALYDRAFT_902571 [Arabidopsis lyrata subsp. lyrata]